MNLPVSPKAREALASSVVQHEGHPLVVYRGEHGHRAEGEKGFRSSLGSLSFGSYKAAVTYATQPNDRRHGIAVCSMVHAVCLDIRKPLVNDETDPFIDISVLIEHFGVEVATTFAIKLSDHIENTNNWYELADEHGFSSLDNLISSRPDLLGQLYCNIYPLLDDHEFIALAKQAGFDGAVYAGSGETALEPEYRVFSPEQVINRKTGKPYVPVHRADNSISHQRSPELC